MSVSDREADVEPRAPDEVAADIARPSLAGTSRSSGREWLPRWETLVAVGFVLLLFQVASMILPRFLAPDVPAILSAVVEAVRGNFDAIVGTVKRFVIALFASIAIGWILGLLMATVKTAGRLLEPFFAIIMATPALSWILIAVLWIRGIEFRIFFIVLVIAMPFYVVNVYEGVSSIDPELEDGLNQFRPTKWQRVRMLYIPFSVAFVIMTTKSVAGFTMRILVFAELIAASSGIGSAMNRAQANFRVDLLLGWTIVLIAVNFAVLAFVRVVERWALRWRPKRV